MDWRLSKGIRTQNPSFVDLLTTMALSERRETGLTLFASLFVPITSNPLACLFLLSSKT